MTDFFDRFPAIAFALSFTPIDHPFEIKNGNASRVLKGKVQSLHSPDIAQEVENWAQTLNLKDVDVLYIYGLGLGYYFEPIKSWLEEKQERALIFIEDDLAVIDAYTKAPGSDCLQHPQVHLHFMQDPKKWKDSFEALSFAFPSGYMHFTTLSSYGALYPSKISQMRVYMQRAHGFFDTLLSEVLQAHTLFENLCFNFKRIPECFYVNKWRGRFENVPAIICGAGPSLNASIETLKKMDSRALIFAGGSTITALSAQGILPHLGMAFDPNELEYIRLKGSRAFENPFLFAPRVYSEVASLCNGPFGYMKTNTGGQAEEWMDGKLQLNDVPIGPELGREALSVTTAAVALAYAMGCNPIIFAGVDLAFTSNQTYAAGVVADQRALLDKIKDETRALESLIRKKDRNGKTIYSLIKWVMESVTIGAFAKAHPDTLFLNATEGGLPLPGITYKPLEEALPQHCQTQYDIRSLLHAEMEHAQFTSYTTEQITHLLNEQKESLKRCEQILDEMITQKQGGKMALLEMDLADEPAYDSFFKILAPLLDRFYARHPDPQNMKLQQFKTQVRSYLQTLEKTS